LLLGKKMKSWKKETSTIPCPAPESNGEVPYMFLKSLILADVDRALREFILQCVRSIYGREPSVSVQPSVKKFSQSPHPHALNRPYTRSVQFAAGQEDEIKEKS
jgi:hypothetical protein